MTRLLATLLCPLLVGTLAWAADPSPEPDDDNDAKTILGTWQAVRGVKKGLPAPANEIEKVSMEVTKDKMKVIEGDKGSRGDTVTYKLDTKSKPRGIDLTLDIGKEQTLLGIYKIEKGELTLVFGEPGTARPKSFDEKDRTILVLRKAKVKK